MKRTLIIIGILIVVVVAATVYRVCVGVGGSKVTDVSGLPGIYKGESTLVLSDYLKKMAEKIQSQAGQQLLPDGPIPCKVEVKVNDKNEVTMELIDFKMPAEGIVLEPTICKVIQDESVYSLDGKGSVNYGQQKFNYSHKGKIQNEELNVELTLVVIPMVAEPKVIFKGEKI